METIVVSAFYHFTRLDDPSVLRRPLLDALAGQHLRGTVLLAREGVNGTLAGSRGGIDAGMAYLRTLPGCAALGHKESTAAEMPFYRLKVRLKNEIVTMGVPDIDPTLSVGTYVDPADWNDLLADPDVVVIDTRNDYEVAIGTFDRAINPQTKTFRDFPTWFERHRDGLMGKKVALFCTGGIRCEKATSYLKQEGVEDVFHLKGGILKYLENVSADDSRWQGECCVFDPRGAVGQGLLLGQYELCHACRRPVSEAGRTSPNYVPGVSCDQCVDERTDAQRERYAERQMQVEIAKARGDDHVGANFEALKKRASGGDG